MKAATKIFCALALTAGVSILSGAAYAYCSRCPARYGNGDAVRAERALAVENDRDGSLYPGTPCPTCNSGDKDGSIFPGVSCSACTRDGSLFPGPCRRCAQRISHMNNIKNYVPYTPVVFEATLRHCCEMAPLALAHVDFRIKKGTIDAPYSSKLGNYRFRIFGCRRIDKEATLNKGRIMEKNISFNRVFEDVVGDCYKVLPMPHDLCLEDVPSELPQYALTAEITDYFMNICDEYDWDKTSQRDLRRGSSEITVVWRLTDLTMEHVYWKGESTGYGELEDGESNGEIKLIERAFADAVSNLRNLPGFEERLSKNKTPEEISAMRAAMIAEERALNPAKCGYRAEYDCVKRCEIGRPGADISQCRPCQPCACAQNQTMMPAEIMEDFGINADGSVTGTGEVSESSGIIDNGCSCAVETPQILESDGVIADGSYEDNGIQESGDVTSSFDIINSCIDENGNVKADGNCKVVDDTWIDTGDVKSLDEFCVVDTDPCKALTPETIYRLRSSVVQIKSPNGKKGAGLLISDRFILTSGDLVDKNHNEYEIKTVRDDVLKARAVRLNPIKNTALMMLDESTSYTPLALKLSMPEVGQNGFLTVGLLNVEDFKDGEDYLENSARIEGYRYTDERGAEILANTFIQNVTVGGALIYKDCTINGMAPSGIRTKDGLDTFIPTETALRSLGISICGHEYIEESPWQQTVYKPVTEQIKKVQKAPEKMPVKERK